MCEEGCGENGDPSRWVAWRGLRCPCITGGTGKRGNSGSPQHHVNTCAQNPVNQPTYCRTSGPINRITPITYPSARHGLRTARLGSRLLPPLHRSPLSGRHRLPPTSRAARRMAARREQQSYVEPDQYVRPPPLRASLTRADELPALRDGERWIGGFRNIIHYIAQVSQGQWVLDAGLSEQEAADCIA